MAKSYDVEFIITRSESVQEIITIEANDKLGAQVKAYPLLTEKIDVDGCKVVAKIRKHKD